MKHKNIFIQLLIVAVGFFLFAVGLGTVPLFDWDELNFAESAREMIVSGNYLMVQINFEPFWEKPPLFIWMQALSMKAFGINEFAARFPNVIAGIVTLLVLFNIGRKLKDIRFGVQWVLVYLCSLLPFFYFKSGIIDPWFNLFIFLGIYYFVCYTFAERKINPYISVMLSAAFIGLAILTKGPVALLVFLLCFTVYLIVNKFRLNFKWGHVAVFLTTLTIVGGLWFILLILNGNFSIIQDFIEYQIRLFTTEDAGHGGFFMYHFVILLIGVFPASLFVLPTFRRNILSKESNTQVAHFFRWMMIMLWVVLILFTIVKTKIVHYSSLCYFPVTFLAVWYIRKALDENIKIGKAVKICIAVIGILLGLVVTAISFFDRFKSHIIPYVDDEFAVGNMQATANWYGFEPLIGLTLITCVVCFLVFLRKNLQKSLLFLFFGSLFFVSMGMFFITPQVEKYSQHAAIEFYRSKQNEDCYIYPTSKSYAHYFYSNRMPVNNSADALWLQTGDIDKPCYFVVKSITRHRQAFEEACPDAVLLYEKNGFLFYVRYPAGL